MMMLLAEEIIMGLGTMMAMIGMKESLGIATMLQVSDHPVARGSPQELSKKSRVGSCDKCVFVYKIVFYLSNIVFV